MKKLLLIPVLALLPSLVQAQSNVTYKPGAAVGEDAILYTQYGCIMTGQTTTVATQNLGNIPEMNVSDWSYNAQGCPRGTIRSLVRFSELNTLPPTANILSARLNLFGVPNSTNYGNSSYPGSPYGTTNEGWVRRVTSAWAENTVTWNTQPTTTTTNQAVLPVTNSQWNWNTSIDVTALVNDMRANCQNEGFELLLQNEAMYRAHIYASSDNANSNLWPELELRYCDPGFTYCSSALCPYGFTFHPNDATAPDIQWSVNGTPVYNGPSAPLTYNFPGPGTYQVCLRIRTESGEECEHCMRICIAENEVGCVRCKPGVVKPEDDGADGAMMRQAPTVPQGSMAGGDKDFLRIGEVSPNPTNASWSLTVLSASPVKSEVVVYDLSGKPVIRQAATLEAGANTVTVNAKKLPAGSYVLRVSANGVSAETHTVIKY